MKSDGVAWSREIDKGQPHGKAGCKRVARKPIAKTGGIHRHATGVFTGAARKRNRLFIMRTGGNQVLNRFGAVNELGVFVMQETGLKGVKNPSALFLSHHQTPAAGSVVMVTREGTRPLMVEVQSLVDDNPSSNPRRLAQGIEQNRLSMLLAVMNRHGGISLHNEDVFINVVGGVRIQEPAVDLPILLATLSSFRDFILPRELVVFGEVGLAGEIRPVPNGQERLREASKHGFTQAIIPTANAPKDAIKNLQIHPVSRLSDAVDLVLNKYK